MKHNKIFFIFIVVSPFFNYLDKLPLLNFYLKLYFTQLSMKIPIPFNYRLFYEVILPVLLQYRASLTEPECQ